MSQQRKTVFRLPFSLMKRITAKLWRYFSLCVFHKMFFGSMSWNFDVHNVQNNFPSRTIPLAMWLYERISLFQHTWIQNWLCTTFYGVLDDCHIYRKTAERDNTVITFFILCFHWKNYVNRDWFLIWFWVG